MRSEEFYSHLPFSDFKVFLCMCAYVRPSVCMCVRACVGIDAGLSTRPAVESFVPDVSELDLSICFN